MMSVFETDCCVRFLLVMIYSNFFFQYINHRHDTTAALMGWYQRKYQGIQRNNRFQNQTSSRRDNDSKEQTFGTEGIPHLSWCIWFYSNISQDCYETTSAIICDEHLTRIIIAWGLEKCTDTRRFVTSLVVSICDTRCLPYIVANRDPLSDLYRRTG